MVTLVAIVLMILFFILFFWWGYLCGYEKAHFDYLQRLIDRQKKMLNKEHQKFEQWRVNCMPNSPKDEK